MATVLKLFATLLTFFYLVSVTVSTNDPNDINLWCKNTPFPDICEYFMNSHGHLTPKTKPEFRKVALQVSMDRALHAGTHTKSFGKKCRNKRERAAWADCMELYQNTILQLNRTLVNPNSTYTNFDVQTWLSTALTNFETCKTGFLELGFGRSNFMAPFNNVTKLISNTLAINKLEQEKEQKQEDYSVNGGFPSWVTTGDRKLLQKFSALSLRASIVVAKDGSGNYRSIREALAASKNKIKGSNERFVIYLKAGVYKENVKIGNGMKNIMLIGESAKKTIITGSKSVNGGYTTYGTATFSVMGEGFIARGITFRNTAGPKSQAVALVSGSDLSVFYQCSFEGYQDTLFVLAQRQFYKECYIYGTVDFIFGNAAAVLQNCLIYARRPMPGQAIVITAQGRTDPNQNTGISIHNSRVLPGSDLKRVLKSTETYLGRPWKQYSRTLFIRTYLDKFVHPLGWSKFHGNAGLNTLYYVEYKNFGPGSSTSKRVNWPGYHVVQNPSDLTSFTVGNFISGGSWLPETGVPFSSSL